MLSKLNKLKEKHFDRWLGGYARHLAGSVLSGERRPGGYRGPIRHLMFALCDHYEPRWTNPPQEQAEARVKRWHDEYLAMTEPFRDADGKRPQHSFFFPGEEYHPAFFDMIDDMVRGGGGEVELHLHHDGATSESFVREVKEYLQIYADRGHLSRDPDGRLRYAFIHGNWCLANARPDGRWCGVDDEMTLLYESGCYADFTFPSAPDVSQPNIVNQIYWPIGDLSARRAYEKGERAQVGRRYDDRLLMIQGPLALTKRRNRLSMRIENGGLSDHDAPDPTRVHDWAAQNIHVQGRPEWVFVKTYTHGAPEPQAATLLGEPTRQMHQILTSDFNDGIYWKLHYVSAREMYNIAMAAIDGKSGDPNEYRDYILAPPPILQ